MTPIWILFYCNNTLSYPLTKKKLNETHRPLSHFSLRGYGGVLRFAVIGPKGFQSLNLYCSLDLDIFYHLECEKFRPISWSFLEKGIDIGNEWMNEWMNDWRDEWMNEWMNEWKKKFGWIKNNVVYHEMWEECKTISYSGFFFFLGGGFL